MPVPLPDASTVNLVPPDALETELLARACATAAAGPDGITEVQRAVVNATVEAMSGFVLDVAELPPLGPDEFAEVMRRRNQAFRSRMVEVMLLLELLLVPLPPEVSKRVEEYATALGVEDQSAPPSLAQHDWVHVLADFGSTVECEIEVFGFISRANDDPSAFALLAMVLGLFETGYLFNAAKGFFEYDRGHLSRDADRMAVRLADAMARDANAAWSLEGVRKHFGLPAKSPKAVAAGSVTPWEPGGISPFQYRHGLEVAEAAGEEYDSYGAAPPDA